MELNATVGKPGPKPISTVQWNEILDLKDAGKSAKEIIALTGLSQTKVYEVLRSGTRKEECPET
jgi:DNA invertase Pin-like site-specific DNA recombinase